MMAQKKEFTAYKDHIQTVAALVGVLSVLLYVFGYVAERVHWNMLGIIQVPTDHIEFLYRGGNVVISSLVSVLLYPLMSLLEPNRRTVLLFTVIALILVCFFGNRVGGPSFGPRLSRYSFVACLLLLLVLSATEFSSWPESRKDLLFVTAPAASLARDPAGFFQSYVGIMALWLAFYFVSAKVQTLGPTATHSELSAVHDTPAGSSSFLLFTGSSWFVTMAAAGEGGKIGEEETASVEARWIVSVWARRIALTIVLVLFIGLPLIYGSFRFPHEYPVVRVLLAGTAPVELKNSSSSLLHAGEFKNPFALAVKIQTGKDPLSQYLWKELSPATQQSVSKMTGTVTEEAQKLLMDDLNKLLQHADLYNQERFAQVNLSAEARNLAGKSLEGEELVRANRLLLVQAYPGEIARPQHYFGQAGDAMALLYETTSEYVLYHKSVPPAVLRLKKTDVGGLVVYQSKDITASSLDIEPLESRP